MKAEELLAELKRKYAIKTNRALAARLGMSEIALGNWRRKKTPLTPRQIANAIDSASKVAVSKAQHSMLRPIIEFFPLDADISAGGVKYELFPTGRDDNPLHVQLRQALAKAKGIYIFYDTRGQAIYAGKAKLQSLWNEMKSAFNRDRDTQSVYRVRQPTRRQNFFPAYEMSRPIRRTQLRLNEMAAYVSAYEVDGAMINDLEALLVRGFPNDLLNVRMERFGNSKKPTKITTKKRVRKQRAA